jgi:GNAT superfamily N-acetyltransferase
MAVRVWRAEPHEAEVVADLMIGFRNYLNEDWPSDNAFLAGVERLLDDIDTDFLLGAVSDDAPASGIVQLRYRFGLWRAGIDCLLEDLFVQADARGSGLGRALVSATLDRARVRGVRRIELDCNEANDAAQALYASFGFSSIVTGRYGGARDLYLQLRLDDGGA